MDEIYGIDPSFYMSVRLNKSNKNNNNNNDNDVNIAIFPLISIFFLLFPFISGGYYFDRFI